MSYACQIRFDAEWKDGIYVSTCPFRLQNLIYRSLVFAFSKTGTKGEVNAAVQPEEDGGARISFSGFNTQTTDTFFEDNAILQVATSIGAEFKLHADSRGFDILVEDRGKG